MTYPPQQPDEDSEDTQSLRKRQPAEEPVSPFGPAPDSRAQPEQPAVDPFAPAPGHGPHPPQSPYGPPQPPYAQQPPAQPAEPPTVPNQFGPQPPQPPVSSPPVSGPPQYGQPVSGPPQYGQPVSGPPQYGQPVSGPPQYGQPVSGPPQYGAQTPAPPQYGQAQPQPPNPPQYGAAAPAPGTYPGAVDPAVFAPRPQAPPEGPRFTGTPANDPSQWSGAPVRAPRRGMPRWLLVSGIIVIVAAIGVGTFLFVNTGGGPTAGGDPSASASGPSSPPPPETKPIMNDATRLEYLSTGAPWMPLMTPPEKINELSGIKGEYKDGALPALFLVGALDTAIIPYAGTSAMVDTVTDLSRSLDGHRYVTADSKAFKGLKREAEPVVQPFQLDGRSAVLMRYHVIWEDPSAPAGGDTVTIVVADLDGSRAAVMYAAVPDSEPTLQQTVEERLLTLHFNV